MKKLLFLFSILSLAIISCKKESNDDVCGTCYYRKITSMASTGKIIDDKPHGSAFNVCGKDTISALLNYHYVVADSLGQGYNYTFVCSCY